MTELDDIRAIVEAINQNGLALAARRLGVVKSVVSRRIARLEADLGTRLLNRHSRGIMATEAGLEFKARGERILAELAEARDAVATQRGEMVGRLQLSLPMSFGLRYVAPLLTVLSKTNPRLEVDATYGDRHVDLVREHFDAAIRIGVLKDSVLVARRLAAVKLAVVASPGYLKTHKAPQTPADLSNHECLVYSGARDRSPWRFRLGRKENSVMPQGRFLADSGEVLLQAAIAGLGVTVLPTFLVAESFRSGSLVRLLTEYALPEEGLYVLRPPGAYVPGKVRGLIDLLIKEFDGEPVWDRN